MRLNAPDQVWPLFQSRDDPSVRTELIHQVADFGILPKQIIDRFRLERDINSKRALVLCLGVYPIESIAQIDRDDLASELLELYQTSPDAGLHGAIDWLLRHRWGKTAQLDRIKQELVFDEIRDDRDWFVNGGGQTFAIIRGPLEFKMGYFAPTNDVPRKTFWHTHLIPRSFAIGMRQVTVADYSRFLDSEAPGVEDHRLHNHFQVRFPEPECPVGDVSWYDAAKYCNWLSEVERIPREQWCYPEKIGPGMKLPEDHLERTGYRLPTIGEWEYACRAGTLSARPYGNATKWLRKYAWCEINAAGRTQPVGTLMPNDLGLFDVLGNLFEWCANGAFDPTVVEDYSHQDQPVVDRIIELPFSDDYVRHRRSFHFGSPTQRPYSARGGHDRPSVVNSTQGFRIVRTIPLEK